MTEEKKVITINDVDYTEDDLTNEQKLMINLDQLRVGSEAFGKMLADSLEISGTEEETKD